MIRGRLYWIPLLLLALSLLGSACGTLEISLERTATPGTEVTPLSTVPATSTPQPMPAGASPSPSVPAIQSFEADKMEADPGGPVTLTWSSIGATQAVIEQTMPASILGPSLAVPSNGSTVVTIPEQQRYWHEFTLVVSDGTGQTDRRTLSVKIRCPFEYYFVPPPSEYGAEGCPYKPAAFPQAAEQVFERGRMIWLNEILEANSATGTAEGPSIYVLYDDDRGRTWQRFDDTWAPGEPESDPGIEPPQGLYQPLKQFSKLWRTSEEVRARLGWALAQEQSYSGAYQIGWRPYYLFGSTYLRLADDRVAALGVMGNWDWALPGAAQPAILSFQVSTQSANPGDVVDLTWEASGEQVTICPDARYVLFTPDDCRQVPLSGSMTFAIPSAAAGFPAINWILTVTAGDPPVSEVSQVSVRLKCHTTWFFSDEPQAGICPRDPIYSHAAVQRFEHGTIIWIEQFSRYLILEDTLQYAGDARKGLSFAEDPLPVVRDTSSEVSPPSGLYAPESAFGSIWRGDVRDLAGYRDRLGWALAPQSEYEAVYQCDDAVPSGGRTWETCYLKDPDGRIIVLHPLGGWYWLGEK